MNILYYLSSHFTPINIYTLTKSYKNHQARITFNFPLRHNYYYYYYFLKLPIRVSARNIIKHLPKWNTVLLQLHARFLMMKCKIFEIFFCNKMKLLNNHQFAVNPRVCMYTFFSKWNLNTVSFSNVRLATSKLSSKILFVCMFCSVRVVDCKFDWQFCKNCLKTQMYSKSRFDTKFAKCHVKCKWVCLLNVINAKKIEKLMNWNSTFKMKCFSPVIVNVIQNRSFSFLSVLSIKDTIEWRHLWIPTNTKKLRETNFPLTFNKVMKWSNFICFKTVSAFT